MSGLLPDPFHDRDDLLVLAVTGLLIELGWEWDRDRRADGEDE